MNNKVVLGLSGGVDSAVSTYLLKKAGYEVHGVFLDIGTIPPDDARSVAAALDISCEVLDIKGELESKVCLPFSDAYMHGMTPNPCIICNPNVKFPALLSIADRLGARHVATGHYANVDFDSVSGRYRLLAANSLKDQSYMLCGLTQEILSRVLFPLGSMEKSVVRKIAADVGIPVAQKSDSMEICFIPDNDHGKYIQSRGYIPSPGNFIDDKGNILGQHKGIQYYTVGQRRGLGISAGHRIFVSKIDPLHNTVTLSDLDKMFVPDIYTGMVNWVSVPEQKGPFHAAVKVRHSRISYGANIIPIDNGCVHIVFDSSLKLPSPGQFAVFYNGPVLLGGGIIL